MANSLAAPQLPPPEFDILDRIRQSSLDCLNDYKILINLSICDKFLLNLNDLEINSILNDLPKQIKFPLQFSSQLDELNMVSMVALLDCLDEYHHFLKLTTGRGAWETTRYLVMSLYLSDHGLTTHAMLQVTSEQISSILSLPTHLERPMPQNPAISLAEPDPQASQLIQFILNLLHQIGQALKHANLPNLASFLISRINLDDDQLIRQLAGAFPHFRDMYILDNQKPVYLMREALLLLNTLRHTSIPFSNLKSSYPIPADKNLSIMLVQLGLLDTSQSTQEELRKVFSSQSTFTLSIGSATILRAASIACCEFLIDRITLLSQQNQKLKNVTQEGLNRYLLALSLKHSCVPA
ncbi:hypothetical protein O181_002070 [Austropuccinia psidii MF-1]|uniref:Queuosine 5'-phosphate N-glycosylase/hydrolase n=1 Tax=Austropuccinia psidii MF-1 TaxID=1389203 RepID=A0A9Q3GCG8_9BASI|nr:hypothetical protein [Austropuccinia psidii MF-1]